ncbi:MAG: methyltransferase domain-containing protein [Pseudomonadota bacterium]
MRQYVTSLEAVYSGPLGSMAARTLAMRISALWGNLAGEDLLGVGFSTPLLHPFARSARCAIAAMPEAQGALTWQASDRGVATSLVDETRLPFRDGMFSRVILMHGLEEAAAPEAMLREIWRVMTPEALVIVIAANRLGLWARAESTPFGHGRPWTRGQLTRLLGDALFQTTAWTYGLHMPPTKWRPVLSVAEPWERVGETLSRGMGGAVLVEARKRLYADTGGRAIGVSPVKAVRARKGLARLPRD